MSKIFTQLPEELFEHPLWKEIKKDNNDWKWGVVTILRRAAYADQADLRKGQVRISIRQLADEANITKKQAENLLRHLQGITTKNKSRSDGAALLRQNLGGHERVQKGGHEKQVYNILLKGYYENEGTEKGTSKDTPKGTSRGHEGDMTPRKNETDAKKMKESFTNVKDMDGRPFPHPSPLFSKGASISPDKIVDLEFAAQVEQRLEEFKFLDGKKLDAQAKKKARQYTHEIVNRSLDYCVYTTNQRLRQMREKYPDLEPSIIREKIKPIGSAFFMSTITKGHYNSPTFLREFYQNRKEKIA